MNWLKKTDQDKSSCNIQETDEKPKWETYPFEKLLEQIRNLYEAFFITNNKIKKQNSMACITEILSVFDIKQMIRLDNHFRSQYHYDYQYNFYHIYHKIDWKRMNTAREAYPYLTDKEYNNFLIIGSFHPNGYFRQNCVKEMAAINDMLPFIVLRLNDWIEPVQEEAYNAALTRIVSATALELFETLPVMIKVKNSMRRKELHLKTIQDEIESSLKEYIPNMKIEEINNYSLSVRNAFYLFICKYDVLDRDKMEKVMQIEKSIFAKRILIHAIIKRYGLQEEDYNRYIKDKSSAVRRHAAETWYFLKKDVWTGAETLLMDECKNIRSLAHYIFEKHTQFSIVDFYLSELEKKESYIAILGIGESGDKKHAKLLLPYLQSKQLKVVRSALLSLSNLLKEDGEKLYYDYLQVKEPALVKIAYLSSRKYNIHHGTDFLKQLFLESDHPNFKQYSLLLLVREPGWKKVSALLDLCTIKEEPYYSIIWSGMWVQSMYCSLSRELAEEIEQKLDKYQNEFTQSGYELMKLELKHATK